MNQEIDDAERASLHEAIGAVAMASARLEDSLASVLSYMTGSDVAWVLFTGRPARSAIDQILGLIDELSLWRNEPDIEKLRTIVKIVKDLMESRNSVVHALWSLDPADSPSWLPWHSESDIGQLYYAARSRMNKGPADLAVTLADVRELAIHLDHARIDLIRSVATIGNLSSSFVDPPTESTWYL